MEFFNESIRIAHRVVEYTEFERPVVPNRGNDDKEALADRKAYEEALNFHDELLEIDIEAFEQVDGVYQVELPTKEDLQKQQEELQAKKERSEEESYRRSRRRIMDIANLNFSSSSFFLTLTFGQDVTIQQGWHQFDLFIKRLKYTVEKAGGDGNDIKYLCVMELHKNRPVPHFHLIIEGIPDEYFEERWYCFKKEDNQFLVLSKKGLRPDFSNVRLMLKEGAEFVGEIEGLKIAYTARLVEVWKNGFVEIHPIKTRNGEGVQNVGSYMLKYMTKEMGLPEGCTRYSFSRGNLKTEPVKVAGKQAKVINEFLIQHAVSEPKTFDCYNERIGGFKKTFYSISEAGAKELENTPEILLSLIEDIEELGDIQELRDILKVVAPIYHYHEYQRDMGSDKYSVRVF